MAYRLRRRANEWIFIAPLSADCSPALPHLYDLVMLAWPAATSGLRTNHVGLGLLLAQRSPSKGCCVGALR